MLTVLLVKLVATAVVVIGVSVAVGKLGPRLGGIIAGTPIVLGPGYFFMLQERPAAFIESAALSTLHALVATLLFSICFVVSAHRMGALASLGLATLCWIPAALLFSLMPGGVLVAVLMYGVVLLVAEAVKRALKLNQPVVVATSGWFDLLLRGLLAGVLVSVATTLAARSGPLLSGMLVGFPVGLFTIGWTLHQRYGADVARATVSAAQQGMLSLVAFGVVTATFASITPPLVTFLLSLGASVGVSALLFLRSQWRVRRMLARQSQGR
ncbi:hypothetical protein [Halomonas urumqiensis]|uniref:Uncharacterized protein n=1 Tax=Halomonas urumqiensis TaxID=1684789 RepID=A0A2N7UCJ6_9GAMM|nr:hypothetical protein [Halomonas urumqiensis]PMR78176.1 hypothetical protein C1H70_15485 [Halomonas urumqiensis]PTB03325.1 hypothetical protein C6V82_02120 [Halomonas urumqiensis]GHE20512.1 hypothetical protein GCM10017767_10330 [Halomonas urumqiensis]